jgi:GDP-L-fucose synthase
MPTNLYGVGDNYNLKTSHVVPALIRKFHEAKESGAKSVEVWGSGTPRREFMYADDLADACLHLMLNYNGRQFVNVGTGEEVTIRELAETIRNVVGFEGDIQWNTSMPDGTPKKLMDVSKLSDSGWNYSTTLKEGVSMTYKDYLINKDRYNK